MEAERLIMYWRNIEPVRKLRWRQAHPDDERVLQELVVGRENGRDYEVWQDVPVVKDKDSNFKKFNPCNTSCD